MAPAMKETLPPVPPVASFCRMQDMTDRAHEHTNATYHIPRFRLSGECVLSRPSIRCNTPRRLYDALGVSPKKMRPELSKRTQTQILHDRRAAMPWNARDHPGGWQFDPSTGAVTSPQPVKHHPPGGLADFLRQDVVIDNEKFLTKYNVRPGPAPLHSTKNELRNDRLAELQAAGSDKFSRWQQENPAMVNEPITAARSGVEETTSVSPMPNARRMKDEIGGFRAHCGLSPSPTSPRRDLTIGYEYRANPPYATKSELTEERRRLNVQDMTEKREAQDEHGVPHSVRKSRRLEKEYRAAIPNAPRQTLTKLKMQRKREQMEVEHARPLPVQCSWPRFSDQLVPWWMTGGNASSTSPCVPRFRSDAVLNTQPSARSRSASPRNEPESPLIGRPKQHSIKAESLAAYDNLWCIHRPRARASDPLFGKHRIREAAERAVMNSEDFTPLEHFSSFDLIRQKSKNKLADAAKSNTSKQLTSNIPPEPVELATPGKTPAQQRWTKASIATMFFQTLAPGQSASPKALASTTNKNVDSIFGAAVTQSLTTNDAVGTLADEAMLPKLRDERKNYQPQHGSVTSPKVHASSPSHAITCTFRESKTPEILAFAVKNKLSSIRSAGFVESRSKKDTKE